jgi:hypothetical protein
MTTVKLPSVIVGRRPGDHRHALVRATVLRPGREGRRRMSGRRMIRCAIYTRKSSEEGLRVFGRHMPSVDS